MLLVPLIRHGKMQVGWFSVPGALAFPSCAFAHHLGGRKAGKVVGSAASQKVLPLKVLTVTAAKKSGTSLANFLKWTCAINPVDRQSNPVGTILKCTTNLVYRSYRMWQDPGTSAVTRTEHPESWWVRVIAWCKVTRLLLVAMPVW